MVDDSHENDDDVKTWRPRTCFKVRRIFRSTYAALTADDDDDGDEDGVDKDDDDSDDDGDVDDDMSSLFTPAALNQKVTLGREVGEPGALWVLTAKLLGN